MSSLIPPSLAPGRNHDRARRRRIAGALLALGLSASLAACSPGHSDEPAPGLDAPNPAATSGMAGVPEACLAVFPATTAVPDIASAPSVPADWPEPPAGSVLCAVMQTNDVNAVLQYVTPASPDEVLDHYESRLTGYEFVRGDGIGGHPILNATSDELEFAIQTDAGTGSFLVAFEVF